MVTEKNAIYVGIFLLTIVSLSVWKIYLDQPTGQASVTTTTSTPLTSATPAKKVIQKAPFIPPLRPPVPK